MSDSATSATPHERTRKDHATETAEDYVEAIAEILSGKETCRLVDLAQRFGVSHVTVHRIIERLKTEGLVATERYQPITLTPRGKRLARECRRRHEIVFRFLLSLGIDEKSAASDAEGIEHHVSTETLKRFKELTGKLCKENDQRAGKV